MRKEEQEGRGEQETEREGSIGKGEERGGTGEDRGGEEKGERETQREIEAEHFVTIFLFQIFRDETAKSFLSWPSPSSEAFLFKVIFLEDFAIPVAVRKWQF